MELKQAAGSKIVTIAVSAAASRVNDGYDVPTLSQSVDFINVMTYDFHGTWETKTGQNSPLFSAPGDTTNFNTAFSMNYWAQMGMQRSKLLIGIATYGRGWRLTNPSNNGLGAPGNPSPPQPYSATDGFAAYYEVSFWEII
uniref:GH18 domain-containing protein n=1 Tax=Panagrolaimus superbus TaxID=310955 RepID=A0A914Z3M2_9BILA